MSLTVPLLDLKRQFRTIEGEVRSAIDRVLESQVFIQGPEVEALEAEVAAYVGQRFAVGVASGSDGLLLSLMALHVGPGDGVVTSPFTFFATAGTVHLVGARPIFLDIDPETYLLTPECLREYLRRECRVEEGKLADQRFGCAVRAVIPVDLFGQIAAGPEFAEIAREASLAVIEDAAQAIGARGGDGFGVGHHAACAVLSFFPSKNLGGFGDGGMILTDAEDLAALLKKLRVHGGEKRYFHELVGKNARLDALQAAVLRVKLQHLDAWRAARERNAGLYSALFQEEGLAGEGPGFPLTLPQPLPGALHVYNQYVVRARARDDLRAHLASCGVSTAVYYPLPLHLQPCFAYLGHREGDFPEAERAAGEVLALPIFPELAAEEIEYTVRCIHSFYLG